MDAELEYCKDLYDLIEEYTIGVSPDEVDAYYVSILITGIKILIIFLYNQQILEKIRFIFLCVYPHTYSNPFFISILLFL